MSKVKLNTYKEGILNFIFYPVAKGKYVVACRELCLVREDKDAELVKFHILADSKRYLLNVCENKLGEHLLNQTLPKEIEKEFYEYRKKKDNEEFEKWKERFDILKKTKNLRNLIA